jgi:hypothetical protein
MVNGCLLAMAARVDGVELGHDCTAIAHRCKEERDTGENWVRMNNDHDHAVLAAMLARVPRVGQKQRARNKQTQQSANSKLLVVRGLRLSAVLSLRARCLRARCLRVCAWRAQAFLYVVCSSEAGCFLFATTGAAAAGDAL